MKWALAIYICVCWHGGSPGQHLVEVLMEHICSMITYWKKCGILCKIIYIKLSRNVIFIRRCL